MPLGQEPYSLNFGTSGFCRPPLAGIQMHQFSLDLAKTFSRRLELTMLFSD